MSTESDLRIRCEVLASKLAAAEQREQNEKAERNHYAEIAARVPTLEAALAAAEAQLAAMLEKDALAPVLAKVSEEKERAEAERAAKEKECAVACEELEKARARIEELEKKLGGGDVVAAIEARLMERA